MLKNKEKISPEKFFIILFGGMKKVFKMRHLINNIYKNTVSGEKKIQRVLKEMVNDGEIKLNGDTKSYTSIPGVLETLLKDLSLYDIAHFNKVSNLLNKNGVNSPMIPNIDFVDISDEFSKILKLNKHDLNKRNYLKILGAISLKENILFTYKKRNLISEEENYQEFKIVSPMKIIMYKNNVYFSGIDISDPKQTIKLYDMNRISDDVGFPGKKKVLDIENIYIDIKSDHKIKIKYQLNKDLPEQIQDNIRFEYNMNSFTFEAEILSEYESLIRRQIENEKAYIYDKFHPVFKKIE